MKFHAAALAFVFPLLTLSSEAAINVQTFGVSVTGNVEIPALNTIISPVTSVADYGSAINSSNPNIKFTRHIVDDSLCYYWFRAEPLAGDEPDLWNRAVVEYWNDVYWYVAANCEFVDGAQYGTDNYVLLHDTTDPLNPKLVGVLQIELTDTDYVANAPRLIAGAFDANGMTYVEAVAAIQAIPEPSVSLFTFAASGLLLRRRRAA